MKDGCACDGLGLSGRSSGDGRLVLLGGRADQGDGRPVPYHAWATRVVPVPDRDHVTGPLDDNQHLPPEGVAANVDEFANDGIVYDRSGIKVTAFAVEHGIKPAYAYRIDFDGRSVLLSGDTNLSENLMKYGAGVNLVIHEVAVIGPELLKLPAFQTIMSIHTTPSQAGTAFALIHPKLAVYTHVSQIGTLASPPSGIAEIVKETRQTYTGPLVVGEDLMTFDISASDIAIYRAGP